MMKRILVSFGWLLLLLPFISVAGTTTIFNKLTSKSFGDERQVSNFNGINSSGSYDIYIKMGTSENLRIEGAKEVIDNIETSVKNGTLIIRNKKNINRWYRGFGQKVKIYITAKWLNNLSMSGSGNIEVDGTVKSESFKTRISGSGDIRLNDIRTTAFYAAISGSGDITASGTTTSAGIVISGSGDFSGRSLKTNVCDIKVSGSGDISIHADKDLNARVSGSGDITYSGGAHVNVSKSGSGKVSKI